MSGGGHEHIRGILETSPAAIALIIVFFLLVSGSAEDSKQLKGWTDVFPGAAAAACPEQHMGCFKPMQFPHLLV
jgi:hypothetical protein